MKHRSHGGDGELSAANVGRTDCRVGGVYFDLEGGGKGRKLKVEDVARTGRVCGAIGGGGLVTGKGSRSYSASSVGGNHLHAKGGGLE